MVSRGFLDGTHTQAPLFQDDRLELEYFNHGDATGLNFFFGGLSVGSNDSAGNFPSRLKDGHILSPADYNDVAGRYTELQQRGLDMLSKSSGGSARRGSSVFDFAVDGSQEMYMAFSAGRNISAELDNTFHQYAAGSPLVPTFGPTIGMAPYEYTEAEVNPGWNPGKFGSEAVTGITRGKIWIGASLVSEANLDSYVAGANISVFNGRFKKAIASEFSVGRVERIFVNGSFRKVKISFDLMNPHQV